MYLCRSSGEESCIVPDYAEASESVNTEVAHFEVAEYVLHSELFALCLVVAEREGCGNACKKVSCKYPVVCVSAVYGICLVLNVLWGCWSV